MAYEKQTWNCGDTITADKLNHIEDGIAESGGETLIVNIDVDLDSDTETATADKTYQEIVDAMNAGKNIVGYLSPFEGIKVKVPTVVVSDGYVIFQSLSGNYGTDEYGQSTIASLSLDIINIASNDTVTYLQVIRYFDEQ